MLGPEALHIGLWPWQKKCSALLRDISRAAYKGAVLEVDLQGKMCLYNGSIAKYKDVSERLGYGLKMAKIPNSAVIMNNGCLRTRTHRPPT